MIGRAFHNRQPITVPFTDPATLLAQSSQARRVILFILAAMRQ